MARTLLCEIITPERIVYSNEVQMVVAPTIDGEVGILPLHAPLVSALKAGEIRVKWNDEKDVEWFAVSGGYLQVHEDKVIVLADQAEVASRIDTVRAQESMELIKQRLQELPADAEEERAAIEKDLDWYELQLRTARKH